MERLPREGRCTCIVWGLGVGSGVWVLWFWVLVLVLVFSFGVAKFMVWDLGVRVKGQVWVLGIQGLGFSVSEITS